jgi:hypothetical protein
VDRSHSSEPPSSNTSSFGTDARGAIRPLLMGLCRPRLPRPFTHLRVSSGSRHNLHLRAIDNGRHSVRGPDHPTRIAFQFARKDFRFFPLSLAGSLAAFHLGSPPEIRCCSLAASWFSTLLCWAWLRVKTLRPAGGGTLLFRFPLKVSPDKASLALGSGIFAPGRPNRKGHEKATTENVLQESHHPPRVPRKGHGDPHHHKGNGLLPVLDRHSASAGRTRDPANTGRGPDGTPA